MSTTAHKIAFFGTSHLGVFVLDELEKAGILPDVVVTYPDQPKGRKLQLSPTETKVWALEHNIPVLDPELLDDNFFGELRSHNIDLSIVVSYGKIIPQKILDLPTLGSLNVHPSLLPLLRGPSPVVSAILQGDKTGVTLMLLDEKMDHGPIISQKEVSTPEWPIGVRTLEEILFREGGKMLVDALPMWIAGKITPTPQDHSKATYCAKVTKRDALIDLTDDPEQNYRKILAFQDWPKPYFYSQKNGKQVRVIIKKATLQDGKLDIETVTPEGRKEMPYADYIRDTL